MGFVLPVAVVVAGLLVAPSGQAAAQDSLELSIPPLTGKSRVGTRSFELVDRSRPAGFGQHPDV